MQSLRAIAPTVFARQRFSAHHRTWFGPLSGEIIAELIKLRVRRSIPDRSNAYEFLTTKNVMVDFSGDPHDLFGPYVAVLRICAIVGTGVPGGGDNCRAYSDPK